MKMMDTIRELLKGWKTVPNLLSALRIVMVPIMGILFARGRLLWAVFVLALSGLTDFFDGKIARRFNQISDLGKILDPLADKLTQITVAVMLFVFFRSAEGSPEMRTFSWVFLLFVGKEAFMVLFSILMLILGLRPGAAEIWGKVATFAFYLVMLFIIAFGPEIGAFHTFWTAPARLLQILVIVSVVLCFTALFSYVPGVWRMLKERKQTRIEGEDQ